MLSAATRRSILKRATATQVQCASSSTFADIPYIPNALRKTIKTSLINEISKPGSQLWQNDKVNGTHNHHHPPQHTPTTGSIDTPLRTLPPDPLSEWHLHTLPHHTIPSSISPSADPFSLSAPLITTLSSSLRANLLNSHHPVLQKAASYFFTSPSATGKMIRPTMILLLSRALPPAPSQRTDVQEAQTRLAEIAEMIHTASLFHDDVIDNGDTRRGVPTAHRVFGDKMAILAGDYLLARASVCLARLRDVEVVETMSGIIEDLVRGEVMQMRPLEGGSGGDESAVRRELEVAMVYYLKKNFYKTASLMAHSCQSAALLGHYSRDIVESAYLYGKHVGVAFQLVDDILDFEGTLSTTGKAPLSDLKSGIPTAPVLFAAEEYPHEILPMARRKFREEGDVEHAAEIVRRTVGLQRTKDLARVHAELAVDAIMKCAEENEYRDALVNLAFKVVDRTR